MLSEIENIDMYNNMCRVYFEEEKKKGSESALKGLYRKVGCGVAESVNFVAAVCCYRK